MMKNQIVFIVKVIQSVNRKMLLIAILNLENDFSNCSIAKQMELRLNKKHFLNGFLGVIFMTGSYNLSRDVKWIDLACPKCSVLLGAYPSTDGCAALDGGIRLIKCYVSTDLLVERTGGIFKNYTAERMFSSKILETAKDELSFRSIIWNLKTRSSPLQIVLLNPNCWLSTVTVRLQKVLLEIPQAQL